MARDDTSLTLSLAGNVPLPLFADAVVGFSDLLDALSREVATDSVDWVVEGYEVGRTITTIHGQSEDQELIAQTATAMLDTANVIAHGGTNLLSAPVASAARKLTRVLNGVIPSMSISSGTEVVTIALSSVPAILRPQPVSAAGSLTGVIQALSQVRGLTFRIAEETYGRSVAGRFDNSLRDAMREAWGRRATVEGIVTRDARSGWPIIITDVRRLVLAPEPSPGAFVLVGQCHSRLTMTPLR